MRAKTAVFFLTVLLGTGFPLVAETIVVAIGDQPPLLTKDGGIVNRVVQEALTREGYTVLFDWLPIGRMLKSLEDDSLEVYVTPSNTPGQQNPKVSLLAARGVFFFIKSKMGSLKVTRLEDLAGKRVGTVTNSPLKPLFEKAGIIVDEGPFETMFLKLEAGRVDFTSTADVGGLLTIKALFPGREQEFDFTDYSYMEIATGLYVKTGSGKDQLLNACKRGFEKMKQDGTLTRFMQEFFGPTYAKRVKIF